MRLLRRLGSGGRRSSSSTALPLHDTRGEAAAAPPPPPIGWTNNFEESAGRKIVDDDDDDDEESRDEASKRDSKGRRPTTVSPGDGGGGDGGELAPPAEVQNFTTREGVDAGEEEKRKKKTWFLPEKAWRPLRTFLVLCVGLVATHFVAMEYAKSLDREEMTAYRADVAYLQTTVFNRLTSSDSESEIIRAALQTWGGGGNLTLGQYSDLTAPGTSEGKGIVYTSRVPAAARSEFETAASVLYGQDIFVKQGPPAGLVARANITEGEDYWPMTYVEPRNDRVMGFDVFSESNRRAAIERVLSTGQVAYTLPVAAADTGETGFSKILPVRGGPSLLSSSSSAADGSGGGGGDDITGILVVFIRVERALEQSSLRKFETSYPGTQTDIGFLASDESRASLHGVPFSDASGVVSSKTFSRSEPTSDSEASFYVETATAPRRLEKRGLRAEYYAVMAGGCLLLVLLFYWERRNFLLQAARSEAAAAREASLAKSRFLRSITHEIRTPMNGIVGMAQLLESVELPDAVLPYVNVIHSCSSTLLSLVNNILDMSKIEAGKMEISKRSFRLDTLAVEMVESAWTVLHTSNTSSLSSMSLTIGSSVPRGRVVGDDVRIRQLFNNFMSNATKFTRHGSIDLFLDATQTSGESEEVLINLTVRDTGIGMAPDAVERLFKPFVQVHDSATTNVQGTGLGLAISVALARAMGGDVTCSSVLGKGSKFHCTFNVEGKLRKATTVAHRRVYTRDDGVRVEGEALIPASTEDTFDGSGTSATPREVEGGAVAAHRGLMGEAPRPPSVLVVDDNKINRMVLSKLLGSLGVLVESADTGVTAVESCGQQRFSLILLDMVMPVMDGVDAARELRAGDGPCKDTPIIFLTADCSTEAMRECREAGGNEFSTKPVRRETLVAKMADLLQAPERSWLLDKEREFCESRKQATHLQGMARVRAEESSTRSREDEGD